MCVLAFVLENIAIIKAEIYSQIKVEICVDWYWCYLYIIFFYLHVTTIKAEI